MATKISGQPITYFYNNSFFFKKKQNKNGKNEFIFNEAKAWIIFQRIFPDPIANLS